jgi:hypothetical protein
MRVEIRFNFGDDRLVEINDVRTLAVQDYVFNGQLRPESAMVINNTAYELRLIADIRMTVHEDR